jgi:Cu2+-containing amine oxidase
VAHHHDSLWRIDLDLNGERGDYAFLTRHIEPLANDPSGLNSLDTLTLFNGGVEGWADWRPEEFSTLVIQDSARNASGHPMSYELEPLRTGTSRHFAAPAPGRITEQWTQHDFWVTRYKRGEDTAWAETPAESFTGPDGFLLPYTSDKESIANGDLVIWYLAGAHHEPISEDLDTEKRWAITLMHWYGFDLKPHDFFDFNPLGGPPICD